MSANSNTSHSPTPVTDIAAALHEKFYREHPEHVPPTTEQAETPVAPSHSVSDSHSPHRPVSVEDILASAGGEIASSAEGAPAKPRRRIPLSYGAGVALIAGGVAGVVLPGIPGFPLLILGAAVLAPTVPALASADTWVQENFPEVYKEALDFADRFAADFEKRFPSVPPSKDTVDKE
ncbi:MAG TPA: hypothetical protein VK970_24870 [Candidatus Methylacidiphilales bacterium]|nr:hypothetical protein [Candidatus Methylacidiphilales bacterium]